MLVISVFRYDESRDVLGKTTTEAFDTDEAEDHGEAQAF